MRVLQIPKEAKIATKKTASRRTPKAIDATQNMEEIIKKSISPLIEEFSKVTTKVDSLQGKADNLTTNVFQLQSNVNDVEDKIEEIKSNAKQQSDQKPKPTRLESYGQLLTVISIAAAVILTFTNIFSAGPENEKTVAETEQINTETLKTRVELQQMLDDLTVEKSKGVDAYNEQLDKILPELQATITRLNDLNAVDSNDILVENLYKSLLIGIFGTAVFFFLNTFTIIWSWLMSSLLNVFYSFRPEWKDKVKQKRYEKTQKVINLINPIFSSFPSLIILVIQIYVFTSLSIPLFDSISASLGMNVRFSPILEKLWEFDLRSAVEMLRTALFNQ